MLLDWKSAWIQEILQKADHAMTIPELYIAVDKILGHVDIVHALHILEALNMVITETDTTWRIK